MPSLHLESRSDGSGYRRIICSLYGVSAKAACWQGWGLASSVLANAPSAMLVSRGQEDVVHSCMLAEQIKQNLPLQTHASKVM